MCGFIGRVSDSPHVKALMAILGLDMMEQRGGQFRPRGALLDVLVSRDGELGTIDGSWWYALQREGQRWLPNPKITSFNARDLQKPRWAEALATRRGIVFCDSIGERHQMSNTQYLMHGPQGLALAVLYKPYVTEQGLHYGMSVITRDPHPRLSAYHEKACPLFLPPRRDALLAWLDPTTASDQIEALSGRAQLHYPLECTPVKTYVRGEALGPTVLLPADW